MYFDYFPPSISLPSLLRNAQMLLTVHSPNNGAASSSAGSIRGESEEAFFLLVMGKEEIVLGNLVWTQRRVGKGRTALGQ